MKGKKLLIVDDELNSRTFLSHLLEEEGYLVHTAENGREAMSALEREPFNLVLTDIRMPVMDGIELFHLVKNRYPHIPVVLFTAYGTIKSAVRALKEGAFSYLEKPVNITITLLKHTIKQAIEIQTLESEIAQLRKQLNEMKANPS